MGRLFGTDGVRGVANKELTPTLAFHLGKAGAYVLSKDNGGKKPVLLIGKDTRISGDMLEDALSAGIMAMGGDVIKVGVMPTPAVAYLVQQYGADAGAVISASHNPFEYNGIKFFKGDGYKLDDEIEDEIEDIIIHEEEINADIVGEKLGRCLERAEDAEKLYEEYLRSTIDISLKGMKVVIDCANGASYRVAEAVLQSLGAELVVLSNAPDGFNINAGCGSTHPENLQKAVTEHGADLGLAFDGDADRLICVDEKGRVIDGDRLIYICAKMLKEEGSLFENRVTATVMSNIGFHKAVEAMGCTVDVTQVGDRYVLESMLKTGCVIGGEQSGHIIFKNHSTTGDGILSGLQVLQAVKRSGRSLSELADEVEIFPQVLKNAKVRNENKKKYGEDAEINEEIQRISTLMEGRGRVLIRPSGTEPLIRVMLEGQDTEEITKLAEGLAKLLTRRLG